MCWECVFFGGGRECRQSGGESIGRVLGSARDCVPVYVSVCLCVCVSVCFRVCVRMAQAQSQTRRNAHARTPTETVQKKEQIHILDTHMINESCHNRLHAYAYVKIPQAVRIVMIPVTETGERS